MKKILLISHSSHIAGAERMLLNFVHRFYKEYEIYVVLPNSNGALVNYLQKYPITLVYSRIPWFLFSKKSLEEIDQESKLATNELMKHLSHKKIIPNLIITNTLTNTIGVEISKKLNTKHICWVHGVADEFLNLETQQIYNRKYISKFENYVLKNSLNIAPSYWTKRYYENLYNVNVEVVSNFTSTTNYDFHEKSFANKAVLFGNLTLGKGVDFLVKICNQLERSNRDFKIDCYSDYVDKTYIKQLQHYSNLGLLDIKKRTPTVEKIYTENSILLSLSNVESFGMTLLEGLDNGLLCISSGKSAQIEVLGYNYPFLIFNETDFINCIDFLQSIPQQHFQLIIKRYRNEVLERLSNNGTNKLSTIINSN